MPGTASAPPSSCSLQQLGQGRRERERESLGGEQLPGGGFILLGCPPPPRSLSFSPAQRGASHPTCPQPGSHLLRLLRGPPFIRRDALPCPPVPTRLARVAGKPGRMESPAVERAGSTVLGEWSQDRVNSGTGSPPPHPAPKIGA